MTGSTESRRISQSALSASVVYGLPGRSLPSAGHPGLFVRNPPAPLIAVESVDLLFLLLLLFYGSFDFMQSDVLFDVRIFPCLCDSLNDPVACAQFSQCSEDRRTDAHLKVCYVETVRLAASAPATADRPPTLPSTGPGVRLRSGPRRTAQTKHAKTPSVKANHCERRVLHRQVNHEDRQAVRGVRSTVFGFPVRSLRAAGPP